MSVNNGDEVMNEKTESLKEFLSVIPEDKDLDYEHNKEFIDAYLRKVGELENRGLSKWEVIQKLQYAFDRFVDSVRGFDRSKHPECWVMANALSIRQETAELIDGVAWKHWKNYDTELDRDYILEELVDILHFYTSMLISLGKELKDYVHDDSSEFPEIPMCGLKNIKSVGDCNAGKKNVIELVMMSEFISQVAMSIYHTNAKIYGSDNNLDRVEKCLEAGMNLSLINLAIGIFSILKYIGFSEDDLYTAYIKKNLKNFLRQMSSKFRGGSYYAGDNVKDTAIKIISEL